MSTVRFRLDDEQLPFSTAAQSHQFLHFYRSCESNTSSSRTVLSPYQKCEPDSCCTVRIFSQFSGFEKEPKFAGYSPIGRISPSYGQTGSQGFDQTFGSLGPGGRSFFQSNGTPSGHIVETVHEYSSSSSPTIAVQKMDSPFLYNTSCRVHETANNKPLQQELFDGRMERPAFDSVNSQRSNSPKYDLLARLKTRNPLLADSVDTDICLSMVNETRPSYQIKTAGKEPLSPPHLTSLIENGGGARQFSKFSSSSDRREPFHAYFSPSSPSNYSTLASTNLSPASYTKKSFSPTPQPPPPPPPPLPPYPK
uniref:Uncharacterized protein n=1 Tax=Romanomermis culicivorax TaxID=13658 RepID=A0A915L4J2_ROMCU